jgi:hypothetical protein
MRGNRRFLACGAAALVFSGCLFGGGGSETTAEIDHGSGSETVALAGRIVNADGTPAAGAKLRLRPQRFLADTSVNAVHQGSPDAVDTTVDSQGYFKLDSVPRGEYYLEAGDGADKGVLIPCVLKGDTDTVRLAPAQLRPTGAVTGTVVVPNEFAGRTYVLVYGVDRVVRADSLGGFTLSGLPEGTYTLRAQYSAPAVDPKDVEAVKTTPQGLTDIGKVKLASFEKEDYIQWPYSKRIYINTGATGANTSENVYNFPLLVRLNQANFDFAQSHGTDLRFEDGKGSRLRYEIERWDSAAAVAEVWVRVDVINADAADQFITMYWGKTDAPDWSDGREVFGRVNGYAGVWHLAEEAPDTLKDRLYRDAMGIDAGDDRIASTDTLGLIGRGHDFGPADYIQVPVADPILKPDLRITVSAWVKSAKTGLHGGNILTMGDSYNLRLNPTGDPRFSGYDGDVSKVETVGLNLLDDAWHHLAGTFDGLNMKLYVDGVLKVSSVVSLKGIKYTGTNVSPRFVIGKHAIPSRGDYNFLGHMDEAEVAGEVRSADWIKLNYENQRADSKLLEFHQ